MSKNYELLGLYEAYNTDAEGIGRHMSTIGFFSTESKAEEAADKKNNPYTSTRTVPAIKVDGKYFLLSHLDPVDVDNKELHRFHETRKRALSKLTAEEIESLGIRVKW